MILYNILIGENYIRELGMVSYTTVYSKVGLAWPWPTPRRVIASPQKQDCNECMEEPYALNTMDRMNPSFVRFSGFCNYASAFV